MSLSAPGAFLRGLNSSSLRTSRTANFLMEERKIGVHSGMDYGGRVAEGLLCELENVKDKLLHFDTVGLTGLHPAHAEERTITS